MEPSTSEREIKGWPLNRRVNRKPEALLRNERTSIILASSLNQIYYATNILVCSLLQRNILVWTSYFLFEFELFELLAVVDLRLKTRKIFHNAIDESKSIS